jgi:nucleotide-binding universal stress UspA family protein
MTQNTDEPRITEVDPGTPDPRAQSAVAKEDNQGRKLVVVGVTGLEESDAAVRWAARYTQLTGARLLLVHAWVWPLYTNNTGPVEGIQDSGLRRSAELVLEHSADVAREVVPGLEVETDLVIGRSVDVMLNVSEDADLVVIGSRGLGRFLSLIVGSVGLTLAARGKAPTVIVRGEGDPNGPVSIAYNGTAHSENAIRQGVEMAKLFGRPLRVVHQSDGSSSGGDVVEKAKGLIARIDSSLEVSYEVMQQTRKGKLEISRKSFMYVTAPKRRSEVDEAIGSTTMGVLQNADTAVLLAR